MTDQHWNSGDRLVHTGRPEWGVGQVLAATSMRQDGKDAQRLTIRFERAGTKTISTAVASLAPPDMAPQAAPGRPKAANAEPAPSRAELLKRMVRIPDSASDPFRPLASRLEATTGLYRFEPTGRLLLDWAASQTGLVDPLSTFTRPDLEEAFKRFQAVLDAHLRTLVHQARREEPAALAGLGNKVSPAVRQLLTRMLTER